jgi:hypothetical protein
MNGGGLDSAIRLLLFLEHLGKLLVQSMVESAILRYEAGGLGPKLLLPLHQGFIITMPPLCDLLHCCLYLTHSCRL